MYSEPRPSAIAVWIGAGSGRDELAGEPADRRAGQREREPAHPDAHEEPSSAGSAAPSSDGARSSRVTRAYTHRQIRKVMRPAARPRINEPAAPTRNPTRPPTAASSMEAREGRMDPSMFSNAGDATEDRPVTIRWRRGLAALALGVEERHRHHGGADLAALALHGPFDAQARAQGAVSLVDRPERRPSS